MESENKDIKHNMLMNYEEQIKQASNAIGETQETQTGYTPENHPNTLEYRKIQQLTADLRQKINEKMDKMRFTEDEKAEVNEVLNYFSVLKEAAKIPLIRVDENSVLDLVEDKVKENIKLVSSTMLERANKKMQEIIDRKLSR